jgi:hypothetical protein
MKKLLFLLSGVAVLALAGCESTTVKEKVVPDDLCARFGVVCNDPSGLVTCDPVDGECKCGGALGSGVVCGDGEVCTQAPGAASPSCVSKNCENVVCDRYEACDPADGVCKCNGVECAPGDTCVEGVCRDSTLCDNVTCPEGETCDPATGICMCGEVLCSVGQSCRSEAGVTQCVGRLCVGNNCPAGTECNPLDGLCHCGGPTGPVCSAGQACEVDEETETASCAGTDICAGVVCQGGTTCSPLDGQCRCGGYDTAAPICGDDQTCDQALGLCVGGDRCRAVTCDPASNTSCDDEEGVCKCGGTGGVVCGEDQGCVAGLDVPMCVKRCNPLTPNVAIDVCGQAPGGTAKGCYYSAVDKMAFCADAGQVAEGLECTFPTDCASGLHCVAIGTEWTCRQYCDTVEQDCYGDNRFCVGISGAHEVIPNLGACLTVGGSN